ncbi:MAG: hypothetical protein K8I27_00845 [Planctomycetes bacterium]|nr:hypothetical protein [Planctomycetota bacterium]
MYTNQHGISRGHSTGLPSARELRDQSCTDDTVRGMLDDIGTALWQIVMIGSSVLGTINVKQLRAIVGPDLRLPDALLFGLRETGQSVDDFLHPAKPAEEDKPHNTTPPAKRPRGAKHPLLGLIESILKAALIRKKHPRHVPERVQQTHSRSARIKRAGTRPEVDQSARAVTGQAVRIEASELA